MRWTTVEEGGEGGEGETLVSLSSRKKNRPGFGRSGQSIWRRTLFDQDYEEPFCELKSIQVV